jgi:acetyl-CoA acyltransferase
MTGTRVAGVGMTPFGKFPDRSLESLGLEALDDAQLDIGDVQAVYAGHARTGRLLGRENGVDSS